MFAKDILFWNVDTQIDFMSAEGKLYAPGAERIQPILKKITTFASKQNIQVVNSADFHFENSEELSKKPNFITTFPEHCMANTKGAEYVDETNPEDPVSEVLWNQNYSENEIKLLAQQRNIIIRKDAFDVFEGNPNTEAIVEQINPKKIFVYGVTTNVCVDCAAIGLADRNISVFVIEDAIKELPNIPLPFENWTKKGIQRISFSEIKKYLD